MSGGPILEVGRGLGGSTSLLLGASAERPVVSIDDREATNHSSIANHIFQRADVAKRLKLYRQTSREPIAEQEFGMLFIDADHSYEGVCHDIGMFWNSLKSFEGKPALAAFHDAAENPISYVESVKQACDELLAESGVARVVDRWGSMLLVEKLRDIDPDAWFRKELSGFWEQYTSTEYPLLKPSVRQGQLHSSRPALVLGEKNSLGGQNIDGDSWIHRGVRIERAPGAWLTADNALRLVRETSESGEHGIERSVALGLSRFNFTAFMRPHHLRHLRLSLTGTGGELAHADFDLNAESRIENVTSGMDVEVLDASFDYRNGCFMCSLAIALTVPTAEVTVAVRSLDASGREASFVGNPDRGFFVNLLSLREVL
jgi:hypothetical protein